MVTPRTEPRQIAAGRAVKTYGGALWRSAEGSPEGSADSSDCLEVLLVHRPSYQDWSLPKGKPDPGESGESCALREVEEETGIRCELGAELGTIRCVERNLRSGGSLEKVVTVFAMRPVSSSFRAPDDEVDQVLWCSVSKAREMFSCTGYVEILDALEQFVRPCS